MLLKARSSGVAALTSLLVIASCQSEVTKPPDGPATLTVTANVSGTAVTTVVLEVTGPGITTPLLFNIPIANGTASLTITIPAGSDRTITARAFDLGGVVTHSGSVTVNIQPGTSASVTIVLAGLTGDAPITVVIGNVTVTVTPGQETIPVQGTVQLTATMVDPLGNPVSGSASWATQNPGVATVSTTGLVTGVGLGGTLVVATFQGAAGLAAITVGP